MLSGRLNAHLVEGLSEVAVLLSGASRSILGRDGIPPALFKSRLR